MHEQPVDGRCSTIAIGDHAQLRGERASGRHAAARISMKAVVGTEHAEDARVISAVLER